MELDQRWLWLVVFEGVKASKAYVKAFISVKRKVLTKHRHIYTM